MNSIFDVPFVNSQIVGPSTLNLSGVTRTVRMFDDIDRIMEAVGGVFGVSRSDLTGQRKYAHLVWARHIGMTLCYGTDAYSLEHIANRFGRSDHGTVMHAIKNVEARCGADKRSREQVERVKGMLK